MGLMNGPGDGAPRRYLIPAQMHRVEEEIKRSRFITTLGYAPTVAAARSLIASVSAEYADASHNCWAYLIGPPGATGQVGLSDAGEPHGTAGRPMLTVLLHSGIGDICAVVTRYFGGTLLGKGGLVKAYSGGVQLALQTLPTVERVPRVEMIVVVEYAIVTPLKRLLPLFEAEILDEIYAADVTFHIRLPAAHVAAFTSQLTDLSNGQLLIEMTSSASTS
jgi:uncharacterized YigZ family protein